MTATPNHHPVPSAAWAATATWSLSVLVGGAALLSHGTSGPLLLTVVLGCLALPMLRHCLSRPPRLRWRDRELLEGLEVTSDDASSPGYREPCRETSIRIVMRRPREGPAAGLFLGGVCLLLLDSIAANARFPEDAQLAVMGGWLPALALLAAYLLSRHVETMVVRPLDRSISGRSGEVLVPRGATLGVYREKVGKHVSQVIELVEPRVRICSLRDRPLAVHVAELLARMIDDVTFVGTYRYEHAWTARAAEVIRIPLERPRE